MSFQNHPAIAAYHANLQLLKSESYRDKEDARSGLVSDPNRKDEPKFILDLIGKVATVSLETQRLIGELPPFNEPSS
ncbi:MAG TPA: hypothetical protein VF600_08430 [Abditibacteriaceae bacterium]|jgi:predicted helicase